MHFILSVLVWLACSSCEKSNVPAKNEGKLIMVAGQSNAVGVGNSTTSVQVSQGVAFEYDAKTDEFIHLQDPVGSSEMGFQKAEDGSFLPALAQAYYELSDEKVYMVQAAKGGSACHKKAETNNWGNWSYAGTLFEKSVEKARLAEDKSGLKLSAIIWSQGENDGDAIAHNLMTKAEFKTALEDLITRYRQEFGNTIPFCIIETGRHKDPVADDGFAVVRQVQREIADADQYTFIVYAGTDKFMEYNWLTDVVHYNQTALNKIGSDIAKCLQAIFNKQDFEPDHGVMTVAHRGASSLAPENTLAAVNLAWEMDASAVEIDIHLTKDNKIVVCHDADTKRVSGTELVIAETDASELRKLDVGSTFSSQYSGEKIPFLSEVIETVPVGKFLFIEIKCSDKVVPFLKIIIEESGKINQVKIISFSETALIKSKQAMPSIPVFWLVCPAYQPGIVQQLLNTADSYHFDGLDINYGLLKEESNDALKELNRYVYVWTVDSKADAKLFETYNVFGITTNKPDILK